VIFSGIFFSGILSIIIRETRFFQSTQAFLLSGSSDKLLMKVWRITRLRAPPGHSGAERF
jgi:hypothetical protein